MFVAGWSVATAAPEASVSRSVTGVQVAPSVERWRCIVRPLATWDAEGTRAAESCTSWPHVSSVADAESVRVGGAGATANGGVLAGGRPAELATRTTPGAAAPATWQPSKVAIPPIAWRLRPPVQVSTAPGGGAASDSPTIVWLDGSPANVCPVASTTATTGWTGKAVPATAPAGWATNRSPTGAAAGA